MTTLENQITEATEILKLNNEFGFLPKTTADKLASGIRNENEAMLAMFLTRANNNQGSSIEAARQAMAEAVKVSDVLSIVATHLVQNLLDTEVDEVKWLRKQLRNFASKVDRQKKPGFERFVARLDALLAVGTAHEVRTWREQAMWKLNKLMPSYTMPRAPQFVLAA